MTEPPDTECTLLSMLKRAESGRSVCELCLEQEIDVIAFNERRASCPGADLPATSTSEELSGESFRLKVENTSSAREKEFDILYGTAQQTWSSCLEFIFKQGMFIVIAAGLVLGPGRTGVLRIASWAPYVGITFFLFYTCMHAYWLFSYWKRSEYVMQQLLDLNFVDRKRYWAQRLRPTFLKSIQAYHVVVTLIICATFGVSVHDSHYKNASSNSAAQYRQVGVMRTGHAGMLNARKRAVTYMAPHKVVWRAAGTDVSRSCALLNAKDTRCGDMKK